MNQDTILDSYEGQSNFFLNSQGIEYIRETAKWAKFLAIVGFVMIGFMVIFSLMFGAFSSTILSQAQTAPGYPGAGFPIASFVVLYLLLAVLYFFPTLYLFRYATKTQSAIRSANNDLLIEGLGYMKSVFKFWGILTIVILGLYALIFLFAILAGGLASF